MMFEIRPAPRAVIEHNEKIRLTNLHRGCFDDVSYDFKTRLASFAKAYDMWPPTSLERERLVHQFPVLANMLRMERAKVNSYD